MSGQEKLALGLGVFTALFLVAFLIVPASVYESYRAHLRQGKRGRILPWCMGIVLLLSLPYFYDELVGLDNPLTSRLLEWTIGACAYALLLDIGWFLYRQFGPPARRNRWRRS